MPFIFILWLAFLTIASLFARAAQGQLETNSTWQVPVDLIVVSEEFRLHPVQPEYSDGLFPSRQRARLRVLSPDTLEVSLEIPVRVPLYRGYQLEPVAERRLQRFRIQTSPEQVALLSQLRLGDSLVTSDETLQSMQRVGNAERPIDHDPLIQEIMDRRTSLPRVYRFRSLVLPVPLEQVGRETPAFIESIKFMGEAQQLPWAEFTYAGEKESMYRLELIHHIFHQGDPELLSYRTKVTELIGRMAQLRHRGWLYSPRDRAIPHTTESETGPFEFENVVASPTRLRCTGLFK